MEFAAEAMRLTTSIFLALSGVTAAVWILRGVGLLTFMPGGLIWFLIMATVAAGIFDVVQRTRRW
ncbi:MAG: hypothetical protein KME20_03835 [Kaiparowitsia implicata GSE-PSE-MK54-09C]|jgi:hypothetical protein|nr:hypothetical protein [Kaiparowitsia implicata GSE-PSE-MK54-09C]